MIAVVVAPIFHTGNGSPHPTGEHCLRAGESAPQTSWVEGQFLGQFVLHHSVIPATAK